MGVTTVIERAGLSDLHTIAQNASPTLSFWAIRGVKVTGYEGEASIDALAARVIALVHEKNFQYTSKEREMGKEIVSAINRIYKKSAQQIAESNCITRLFWNIYSFFNRLSGSPDKHVTSLVRWRWEDFLNTSTIDRGNNGYKEVFNYYTPEQYLEQTGKQFSKNDQYWVFGVHLVHNR